ncbi:FecR family protein [Parabacteroides bouchesdurhonensis]|uniref:FecR family protein n=1 Tax=Parabacteroides bouchesdurhonensis TaxID=1936995 RepID=UPI000C862A73|nr:FecR family protein [Parabacteroides bouchesdurhonensis]
MDHNEIPYAIIAKYFAGEINEEEGVLLEKWKNASPENEDTLNSLYLQWDGLPPLPESVFQEGKSGTWERILNDIKPDKKIYYIRWTIAAAVAAFLIGLYIPYFTKSFNNDIVNPLSQTVFIAPSGQKSHIILPDGTKVWLNSDSRLTYSTSYNMEDREVYLEGEAYFDVVKSELHRFIVKTDVVDVNVLGTEFNVSAYPENSMVQVFLTRGSVRLESANNASFLTMLKPGEKAEILKSGLRCTVSSCDVDTESSWRLNKLHFEGAYAYDVFKKAERWYGVKFHIENENKEYRYWFTLKTESLTELLQLINKITPIEYEVKGEEVTLKYK